MYLVSNLNTLPASLRLIDERADVSPESKNRVLTSSQTVNIVKQSGLDLVCIVDDATPKVYKLVEWSKFKYDHDKKEKEKQKLLKKNTKGMKDIMFGVSIADHDYAVKIRHIRALIDTNDVRIFVDTKKSNAKLPRGMSMKEAVGHPDFVLNRVISDLGNEILCGKMGVGDTTASITIRKNSDPK